MCIRDRTEEANAAGCVVKTGWSWVVATKAGFTLLFQRPNVGVFTQKTKMTVALDGSANAGSADIGWLSSLPILMQESLWW